MTRETNAGIGVARYLQVYTVLSQALAEGSIGAGQALPSEPSLVREYGVSRTTVRRALARLAKEHSIIRRRGSGTFARENGAKRPIPAQTALILDDPRSMASNTTRRIVTFETAPTPDFLHRDWPEFGAQALTIRKIRYIRNEPVAFVTSYVPEELGKALTQRRLGNDTVLVALEKQGIRGATAEQDISAIAADPLTARHLDCEVGTAVLNLRRLTRDAKGQIVEFANLLYRPDRYEFHTMIERGAGRRRQGQPS